MHGKEKGFGKQKGLLNDVCTHWLLQELTAERDEGASMIHQTTESGERLYPNTASEGRDIIRQELR